MVNRSLIAAAASKTGNTVIIANDISVFDIRKPNIKGSENFSKKKAASRGGGQSYVSEGLLARFSSSVGHLGSEIGKSRTKLST